MARGSPNANSHPGRPPPLAQEIEELLRKEMQAHQD